MNINISFFTAQIISKPQHYYFSNQTYLISVLLRIPNPKKGKSFYYTHGFSISQSVNDILSWYNSGDYFIIQANISSIRLMKNTKKNSTKYIIMNIIKSFPTSMES